MLDLGRPRFLNLQGRFSPVGFENKELGLTDATRQRCSHQVDGETFVHVSESAGPLFTMVAAPTSLERSKTLGKTCKY